MPHVRIVEDENGVLHEVGVVEDAPETTISSPEGEDTPEGEIDAQEPSLDVSEDKETPPEQPEDDEDDASFVCAEEGCGKVCSSKAGLAAHIRAKHAE